MKITISKSSLVGRYYSWLMEYFSSRSSSGAWQNLSLCYFVQNLFWRSLIPLAGILLVLFCCLFILFALLYPYLYFFLNLNVDKDMLTSSVLLWGIFFGLSSLAWLNKYIKEHLNKKTEVEEITVEDSKKPSIIWEWLKAKKKKVCPLINVVE